MPGGLSGGECSWKKEKSACATGPLDRSVDTASVATGGTMCMLPTPNIEFGRRTSLWQQECDAGMFIEPHCCAICLQHSRSASVISAAELRQAIAG